MKIVRHGQIHPLEVVRLRCLQARAEVLRKHLTQAAKESVGGLVVASGDPRAQSSLDVVRLRIRTVELFLQPAKGLHDTNNM